jgi:hypothetical protein
LPCFEKGFRRLLKEASGQAIELLSFRMRSFRIWVTELLGNAISSRVFTSVVNVKRFPP